MKSITCLNRMAVFLRNIYLISCMGKLKGVWECHITPDWLLLWAQNDKELTLYFMDTGTHADLYKK